MHLRGGSMKFGNYGDNAEIARRSNWSGQTRRKTILTTFERRRVGRSVGRPLD